MEECVIVLHGLGRSKWAMRPIAKALAKDGYQVWNESYPSTKQSIEKSSIDHIRKGLRFCRNQKAAKIHFVTHSLGGILVRFYLQKRSIAELGHIVMLSPPNKGSEVADFLKDTKLFQWMTGPAGQQLGTDADSMPNQLNKVAAKIGVITGTRSSDPWFSPLIAGQDDGKVSVESAKLEEMSDFLLVQAGHTFIVRKQSVIEQIKYFLRDGGFQHYSGGSQ